MSFEPWSLVQLKIICLAMNSRNSEISGFKLASRKYMRFPWPWDDIIVCRRGYIASLGDTETWLDGEYLPNDGESEACPDLAFGNPTLHNLHYGW